ncbi:MAG: bifunctional demethylmenaquinone methyltransferase/2-methoxy-6-polyprenyl-1,4-benzoquinol methylase UbiE [Candidatus Poribacteria bacterium]|nr:bifunctional demethylmenaquinone methyltransferase/2-methoxy-6-polyprenyl-1,4-benzoquinol methylase UbiE [Candidatus Poribacteria bacterium]
MNKPVYVRKIFSAIARRYDFLNALLSLRRDRAWRKFTARMSEVTQRSRVLDVCTGTGELALAYADAIGNNSSVIGTDFCFDMLAVGKQKVEKQQRTHAFIGIEADTLCLPFTDNIFDVVSVGFGIRNVADIELGIREMMRVAVKGGRVVILEFTQPTAPVFRHIYYFYFKTLLPCIGNLISKNEDDAYGYLPNSVMQFPDCEQLKALMEKCGLADVRFYRKTLGIVAIHIGRKK